MIKDDGSNEKSISMKSLIVSLCLSGVAEGFHSEDIKLIQNDEEVHITELKINWSMIVFYPIGHHQEEL